MKLGRITGTVTATSKDAGLVGHKLMLTDLIDGAGKVLEGALVAADTCGAGVGDTVLVSFGTAARLPQSTTGAPVDAAIIAVVDRVTVAKQS